MKPFLRILLLVFPFFFSYGQNCFQIGIQKSKTTDNNSKFYFASVIDGRADTGKVIGEVYIGSLNIPRCAAFKENVASTVLKFLNITYPNKSAPAFLVKINRFSIAEYIHKNEQDTGSVFIDLDFYKYTGNNELTFITSVSKTITDVYEDATYSHDNRIKRALMASVSEFAGTINGDNSLYKLKSDKATIASIRRPKDSLNLLPKKETKESVKFQLQIQGNIGWYTRGIGIRAGALFFLKEHPKIAVGPFLFWNYFAFTKNLEVPANVTYLKYKMANAGLGTFTRLNKYLGLTIDASFLLGSEIVTTVSYDYYYYLTPSGWQPGYDASYRTTSDNILGFNFEQGIQFMRQEKRGVNAKLSVYETILSADYFDSDYGVKLSVGINF